MVKVSYHAQEQMKRLSPRERHELQSVLASGERTEQTTEVPNSGKFVTRFGKNKRVVWRQEDGGDIVVLTVVSR